LDPPIRNDPAIQQSKQWILNGAEKLVQVTVMRESMTILVNKVGLHKQMYGHPDKYNPDIVFACAKRNPVKNHRYKQDQITYGHGKLNIPLFSLRVSPF